MDSINPTIEWYKSISAKYNLTPRCPFANIYKCPKYYDSLYCLEGTGATSMTDQDIEELNKYWKEKKLKFGLKEEMPGVARNVDEFSFLTNFCPQATFLRFGYFASHLSEFADEIDKDIRYTELEKINIDKDDWRWYFQYLTPQHYTDCSFYSILLKNPIDLHINDDVDKVELIDSQKEDYKKYKYKCYYKINIIGKDENPKRENYIEINGNGIELGRNNFIFFVKLALELTRNKEGWVNIESFVQEIDLSFTGIAQLIGRLRENLMKIKALDNNSVKELIENKKSGFYRISNHPDFITYNKEKLLSHEDPDIKKFAEELP